MQDLLIKSLTAAYGCVGVVGIAAYWPTVKDLIHKKPSANTSSYFIWMSASLITFLYSLFVVDDQLFQAVSGAYVIANTSIFFLRLGIRKI